MAKRSGEGSASMPAWPAPNVHKKMPTPPTVYVSLWLSGDTHIIQSWKLSDAHHPAPPGIAQGLPLARCVPSLPRPLGRAIDTARREGTLTMVPLATPLGTMSCICTPTLPEPGAATIICTIPLAFFADAPTAAHYSEGHAPTAVEPSDDAVLGAFGMAVLHIDLAGRVVAANARMRELLAVDVGQVLPLGQTHPHAAWHRWENHAPYRWCDLPIARVVRTTQPVEDFILYDSPEMEDYLPFLTKAQPTYDAEGEVTGAAWLLLPLAAKVYEDGITHRRANEIIAVVESMRDGIMLYNAQGELWQMNPAARQMLGWDLIVIDPIDSPRAMRSLAYSPQHKDGRPLLDAEWPMQRALQGENTEVVELSLKRMNSTRISVGISASPLRDAEGTITGAVAVIRDMTLHRRFEQMREGFMSLASHELRTPITSLVMVQHIMQRHLVRSQAQPALLDLNSELLSQLRHLNRLVDNLLDMTGLTGGQFELRREPTDVTKLVHGIIAELTQLHKWTHRVFLPKDFDKPLWLDVDPQRFGQVIYNLLANAVKFSPVIQPVEIELHYFDQEGAPWLSIDIIDAGVGIPEEQLHALFDRVVESEDLSRASGMGYNLYLSRAIAQRHGGTIVVNSVVNLGSTFSVRLPLTIVVDAPTKEDAPS